MLPMLLVPTDYDEASQKRRYGKKNRRAERQGLLYSVSGKRIYSSIVHPIVFPIKSRERNCRYYRGRGCWYGCFVFASKPRDKCCRYYRGCGHGLVAVIDRDDERTIISLVNPFTIEIMSKSEYPWFIFGMAIPKVILFEDPTSNPDNYVELVLPGHYISSRVLIRRRQDISIYDCRRNLAGFLSRFTPFTDAIFYRGQIYIVNSNNCDIIVIDYESKQHVHASPPSAVVESLNLSQRAERAYLVESIKGDSLYIRRFAEHEGRTDGMVTENFRVYTVVLNGSIVEYVEVKSIGDEALFVGDCQSVAVMASSSSDCQPNSIYFTDDSLNFSLYRFYTYPDVEQHVDMGIFHLEDGTISQHHRIYSFEGKLTESLVLYHRRFGLHHRSFNGLGSYPSFRFIFS